MCIMDALAPSGKPHTQSAGKDDPKTASALTCPLSYPYTFGKQASAYTELRHGGTRLPFAATSNVAEDPK